MLDKLHIRETGNQYLWDDLMDNKYPMKATVAYDNARYNGIVCYIESYSNNPHITLVSYMVSTGGKLYDYHNDVTKTIVLDTAKAQFIEITYDRDSDMCDDIVDACKYNT